MKINNCAVDSASGRSAAGERADVKGDGGRGAELPAISTLECDDDEDESTEASDALSTGELSPGSGSVPKKPGTHSRGSGDGSGGKAGEGTNGTSGWRPRAGKGTVKSGRGTDVPRASGCSGRKPGPADQASDGCRRVHKVQRSDVLQTGGDGLVCDGVCGRETFAWTRQGRWPCSYVHHTDRTPAEAAPLCAGADRRRGTARRRGQGSSMKGRGSEPPRQAGRKVYDTTWLPRMSVGQGLTEEVMKPHTPVGRRGSGNASNQKSEGHGADSRLGPEHGEVCKLQAQTVGRSPRLRDARTATSRKPRNKASDGGGPQTTYGQWQALPPLGPSRGNCKGADNGQLQARLKLGKPATRAIEERARKGPVASPCLLSRTESQSGRARKRVRRISRQGQAESLPRSRVRQVTLQVDGAKRNTKYLGSRCFPEQSASRTQLHNNVGPLACQAELCFVCQSR